MPPGENPFKHDYFSMGTTVAKNVMIMHPSHDSQRAGEIYIVNIETGERVRVTFMEEDQISIVGLALKND